MKIQVPLKCAAKHQQQTSGQWKPSFSCGNSELGPPGTPRQTQGQTQANLSTRPQQHTVRGRRRQARCHFPANKKSHWGRRTRGKQKCAWQQRKHSWKEKSTGMRTGGRNQSRRDVTGMRMRGGQSGGRQGGTLHRRRGWAAGRRRGWGGGLTQPSVNRKARLNRTLRQSKQIPPSLAAPFWPLTLVFFQSPGTLAGVR